ncbi:MAG: redoxin domain-containing protein [Myxococcota bacterium]|nr:redoxin domain-containing protein [Myxococcota bacterium]
MKTGTHIVRLVLLSALLLACGGEDPADEDVSLDTAPREGYPDGPYGTEEGSVIANLSFTDSEGATLSFQDLYANPQHRLLLLSTAAGWCSACIEEQPSLQERYLQHRAAGLQVMVAFFENADYAPASVEDAASWKSRHKVGFHVVADGEFQMGAYYDRNLTPLNMLIDVSNMTILWSGTGWDPTTVDAIIANKL